MPTILAPAITITLTGAAAGSLTCSSTTGLYKGLVGWAVKSDGSGNINVIVSQVIDSTHFLCQNYATPNNAGGVDLSLYNGGKFYFNAQYVYVDYTSPTVTVTTTVPSVNSANNTLSSEVVGNKQDDGTGTSLFSQGYKADKHSHSPAKVYPTLAAGNTVTKSATPWTLGVFAVIVPANTITLAFDIHGINYDNIADNGIYEIVLYSGADGAEVEIGRTRFTRTSAGNRDSESLFHSNIVAANSQIKAKLAGSNAIATAIPLSVRYHTY
jgi:hypothetical protein